jgi:hypothetical protein
MPRPVHEVGYERVVDGPEAEARDLQFNGKGGRAGAPGVARPAANVPGPGREPDDHRRRQRTAGLPRPGRVAPGPIRRAGGGQPGRTPIRTREATGRPRGRRSYGG